MGSSIFSVYDIDYMYDYKPNFVMIFDKQKISRLEHMLIRSAKNRIVFQQINTNPNPEVQWLLEDNSIFHWPSMYYSTKYGLHNRTYWQAEYVYITFARCVYLAMRNFKYVQVWH